jgi:hypothetical protein
VAKSKKAVAGSNGKAISKMDAMRQTLETLGKDTMPKVIGDYLKTTYAIEMSPNVISTYKGLVLKGGKKKKKGRKAGKTAAEGASPAASTSSSGKIGGFSIDDIRAVQELAGRLGARKLQELAEVLAK